MIWLLYLGLALAITTAISRKEFDAAVFASDLSMVCLWAYFIAR